MAMAASSEFFKRSLSFLTSRINRVAVFSTAQPTLNTVGQWASRICGTTSPTVGAPASTSNGWVVKISSANALAVSASGKAGHIVLYASSRGRYVTRCTTRNIQGTDTVSIPAWRVRVANPTSS